MSWLMRKGTLVSCGLCVRCAAISWRFQHIARGAQQMLMYPKSMLDRYYCIKHFFCSKPLEKLLQKVLFTCTYNGAEKQVTCQRFENTASRAKTNVTATVHFTDEDVSFYDGPGMLICKTAKPCINSTCTALLIHGFVPVKTWLLIARNTAFYAMDRVKRIWYLSLIRAAKVQASLRIRAVSPEPSLLAHTSSESRGTFRQKARSLAPLNDWACAVKICHDGMLEDTNSLDGAPIIMVNAPLFTHSKTPVRKFTLKEDLKLAASLHHLLHQTEPIKLLNAKVCLHLLQIRYFDIQHHIEPLDINAFEPHPEKTFQGCATR